MNKALYGLAAAVVVAGIASAAIKGVLVLPVSLGLHDYLPPLTKERLVKIGRGVNPRPGEDRSCSLTGIHWAEDGCTLRGVIFTCQSPFEQWSTDTHKWKFDGYACRHSVTSEDAEPLSESL